MVTAQWYFHRNEPAKPSQDITWKAGLLQASSTSLGTIALGSLVLTIVQCLQYATQWIRKVWQIHIKRPIFLILVVDSTLKCRGRL